MLKHARTLLTLACAALVFSIGSIGLIVVAHGQPQQRAKSNSNAQKPKPEVKQEPRPLIPPVIQDDIARIANALEAANAHPNAATEQQQARDNLKAEQDIARWAKIMLYIAGGEITATLIGVTLVGLTLVAARRAATAAEQAVAETRRIGEAQVRAYVSVDEARINFLTYFQDGEAHPLLEIVAKNAGQSPAKNFIWQPTMQYMATGQRRQRGIGITWVGAPGVSIPAGEPFPDTLLMPDMRMVNFSVSAGPPNITVIVRVRVVFSFVDVFDITTTDEAYFLGVAGRKADDPINQWSVTLVRHPMLLDWDSIGDLHNQ
jgi:hypothetical protein